MSRQGRKCRCCQSPDDLQVHHLTYERFGDERVMDLMVLCVGCHRAVTSLVYRLNPGAPSSEGHMHDFDIEYITSLAVQVLQVRLESAKLSRADLP